MNIEYSERLKQSPTEYALAQSASNRLEELLENRASQVSAEWDRVRDEMGSDSLTLRLSDIEGDSSNGRLTLEELRSPGATAFRLLRLYSTIIRTKIDRQMAHMGLEN